jgi:hypothetical protein
MKAIATKDGMSKGYWRVSVVDDAGNEVERVWSYETKRAAVRHATEINESGRWTTGISGFRYERSLATGERVPGDIYTRKES